MTDKPDRITARLALSDEIEVVTALAARARSQATPERGGHLLFDLSHPYVGDRSRYDQLIDAEGACLVVGLVDDSVVGYAVARSEQGATETVCVLDELYVDERARSVGVGAALLDVAQEWAIRAGCTFVESQVLPGNRAAKNFFERVGMVTRAMRVSAPLTQP